MKQRDKKWQYIYMTIAFCVAFIPRIFLCMSTFPVRTISDEIATLSGAAYFAGLDWSGVISKAGYYGSGFYSIFFWIFKLTDNPFIIYKVMLIGSCFIQALVAIISFIIMNRYFKIKDGKVLCIFSIACSYMVVTRANITYNEHILILITWLVVLIILELQKCVGQNRKRVVLTGVLAAILSYSLTIHTRALTLWIACGFVLIIYYLLYRKWLLSKIILVVTGGIGYILGNKFVEMVQTAIWAADGGAVRNSEVNIAVNFNLWDPVSWFSGLSVILGQLNTISIFTGGFIIISFVILTWLLFGVMRDKIIKKELVQAKEKEIYVIIAILCLACVGMTIIAQTISWLPGVIMGMKQGVGTKEYSMKALTYIRYFGPYLGPVLMSGLVFCHMNKEHLRRYMRPSIIIFAILQIFWIFCIMPLIKNNSYDTEVFIALSLWKPKQSIGAWIYLPGVIIAAVVFVIIIILYKKGKTLIPAVLLCILLIHQYVYCSIYNDRYNSQNNLRRANAGYALMGKMESKLDLPDELYVYDDSEKTDHQVFYMYQFLLNRYKIIPELPLRLSEDNIIFSNSNKVTKLLELGYECIPLDKNEFAYAEGRMAAEIKSYWVK